MRAVPGRRPVTNRYVIQGVVLVAGAIALASGWFFATTGLDTPLIRCYGPMDPPFAWILGGTRVAIGGGLILATIRPPGDFRLRDPIVIALFLALAANAVLATSIRGLVTGTYHLGRRGCIEIGEPWSLPLSLAAAVLAGIVLFAAGAIFVKGEGHD
jgi:hypothetical protein